MIDGEDRTGMERGATPLRNAVTSWLATFDILADTHAGGSFGCLRDGLAYLVPIAEANEPGPLRDAVLALADIYDDLCVLAMAGLDLTPETRGAAVERVLMRFDALANLAED